MDAFRLSTCTRCQMKVVVYERKESTRTSISGCCMQMGRWLCARNMKGFVCRKLYGHGKDEGSKGLGHTRRGIDFNDVSKRQLGGSTSRIRWLGFG